MPARLHEENKVSKYLQSYKAMDDIHFEPFVIESGGPFGEKAQQVFKKICNQVTHSTGQCGSNIAYFWKSKLLVTNKINTYIQSNKAMDDHFELFVIESGGQFGEKAQQVFKKICSQSSHPIYGPMRIKHCILLEVKTRSNNLFQRAEMV